LGPFSGRGAVDRMRASRVAAPPAAGRSAEKYAAAAKTF